MPVLYSFMLIQFEDIQCCSNFHFLGERRKAKNPKEANSSSIINTSTQQKKCLWVCVFVNIFNSWSKNVSFFSDNPRWLAWLLIVWLSIFLVEVVVIELRISCIKDSCRNWNWTLRWRFSRIFISFWRQKVDQLWVCILGENWSIRLLVMFGPKDGWADCWAFFYRLDPKICLAFYFLYS